MNNYIEIRLLIEAIENDINASEEFEVGKSYIGALTCPQNPEYKRSNGRAKRREVIGVGNSNCRIICKCVDKEGSKYKFILGGLSRHAGRAIASGMATMWISYIKDNVSVTCGDDGEAYFSINDAKKFLDDIQINNIEKHKEDLEAYCANKGINCNRDTFILKITKTETKDFEDRINADHGITPERSLFAPTPKKRVVSRLSHRALRNRPATPKKYNDDDDDF